MSYQGQRLELAWSSRFSTAAAARVWTDCTADLRTDPPITITRGRNDQQSVVQPSNLTLTLDNIAGQYTPEKASSPNFPNVARSVPVRVTQRDDSNLGNGNLFTANQASMETSVADWAFNTALGAYTLGTSVAQSASHPFSGTNGGLATWSTTGSGNLLVTAFDGFVIGRTYTFSMYVYVPTGSPDPRLEVVFTATSARTSTKNSLVRLSVTFVATARLHFLGVQVASATAGQQCFYDAAMVDEGTSSGTFTTTAPDIRFRGLFYADSWAPSWPTDGDEFSLCTLTASSRTARLGRAATLDSAIRARYLASSPEVYWPMDDNVVDRSGRQTFRDVTNDRTLTSETETISSFYDVAALAPVIDDGTPGPTDEASLVRIPRTTSTPLPDWQHYVGGSRCMKIGTNMTTGCIFELVARVAPIVPGQVEVDIARLFTGPSSFSDEVRFGISDLSTGWTGFYLISVLRDQAGNTTEATSFTYTSDNPLMYQIATDGEIHHYAIQAYSGGAVLYVDDVLVALTILSGAYSQPFISLALGARTLYADLWVGHAAGYDGVTGFTTDAGEHAGAATAATETIAARVTRVAGYLGVPAGEITVDSSYAAPLGRQSEKGRAGVDVLNQIATSTAGVLMDDRSGSLVMLARNDRYNAPVAFTLSATAEEVEADLQPILDGEGLVNRLTVSRVDAADEVPFLVEDATSIANEGVQDLGTVEIVTSEPTEAESYGYAVVARYATPRTRISTVTVDVGDLSAAQRAKVLAADISTLFNLTNLPAQAPASTMPLFVEGTTETIGVKHSLTFNTSAGNLDSPIFLPDDPTFGVLDVGNLIAF